ncbi:MAG: bacillithiol biosynthesis cysteine-adding enzyme BshC [Chitinophagaceae bacterium]|nr:bacillithiol biosynthesis cysteine-adding enzyme BshC [Chitinophagaceae bacterium]
MDCTSTRLPYRQTGAFSNFIVDYIDQEQKLAPFFTYQPSLTGIRAAIEARKATPNDRHVLVSQLRKQYAGQPHYEKVNKNIELLASADTFTVTTAHQPNIFTGPLYFIYKIVHAIRLAGHLKDSLPGFNFVPVYYMGSEDADLDELGHIHLEGKKLSWETKQTGAVGRMKVDKSFLQLIDVIEGQLAVLPFGREIVSMLKDSYQPGRMIQDATFELVNRLFAEKGLLVLIPDNAELKRLAADIFKDDLLHQTPSELVGKTIESIDKAGYKVQANPREINLFYLTDGIRERIVKNSSGYKVKGTDILFSQEQMLKELDEHPERFSPNVILRGIFQETILPNVAFIGGGGEIAYWLQYDGMFSHYKVPMPALILRNSFVIVEKGMQEKISRTGFTVEDFFQSDETLVNKLVERDTKNPMKFNGSITRVEQLYDAFREQAGQVDVSLTKHVDALKTRAVFRLQELEKKMFRAEKRKFQDQRRQIQSIRQALFPGSDLQERYENGCYYYAKWGSDFIDKIYENSLALEQEFVILYER